MIPKLGYVFKSIPTGKLRRYFSFKNFVDFFRIPFGILKARSILKKFKPNVVFSKGGYVSLPVVYAAHQLKIPIILHESDIIPGLANKLCSKKVDVICLAYEKTKDHFPQVKKIVITGNPVREEVFKGDPQAGYKFTGLNKDLPIILIMGGSQGSEFINQRVSLAVNKLVRHYQIIQICGKGKCENIAVPLTNVYLKRYITFEYLNEELADIFSITDLVISRAGANSLAEIEANNLPAILIPISRAASRGEQTLNAKAYEEKHPRTQIIPNDDLTYNSLIDAIHRMLPYENFSKSEKIQPRENTSTLKILDEILTFIQ